MADVIKPKPKAKPKAELKSDVEETETELEKQVSKATTEKINLDLPALERYARLKVAIRGVLLRKSKSGYEGRYFYIPLKHMQAAFTRLELSFGLTSIYTQERTVLSNNDVVYDAVRVVKDLKTNEVVAETRVDITDLVLNKIDPTKEHTLDYLERVLNIVRPKDAWEMIYLNYFDPQKKGALSTYFQRYTYLQLYDFQEVDYDDIETKPQGKDKGTSDKNENAGTKTQKEKRLDDTQAQKLRVSIRDTFGRELIIKNLKKGEKFSSMNLDELKELETRLSDSLKTENKIEKKDEEI